MRLVVVGGVAGGMSAAARARRLSEDADIIVLERGGEVSFANCGLPYFVGGEIQDEAQLLVQTPAGLRASLGIDVRVNTDVVALDPSARTLTISDENGRSQLTYDHLILSPGASAIRPPLAGLDSPRVHTLRTVPDAVALKAATRGAATAVVLGAGFIGLEAAEALQARGIRTSVVELAPHVLPPLEAEMAQLVRDELLRLGIDVRDGVSATSVEKGAQNDVVILSDGTRISADIIVLSVGVRPDTLLWEQAGVSCERGAILTDEMGHTSVEGIWAVGDATASADLVTGARRPVALAGPANRAGRLVADAIMGRRGHALPSLAGTAIVRVGELTVALTGANRRALDDAGLEYHTVHLHPLNHAGYFPGASQIHLLLHFGSDGRVLGAQAIGNDGVDKRIDVLSVAIKAGFTVRDLVDLDLAYSPPYGSAKDPVNMAGMMACNVLDGTLTLWHASDIDDVLATALVLDVRSAAEVAEGSLPGVLNIPHTELRDRMGEVREAADGRPVRVLCASGVRSYLAQRQLVHAGFDAANLSGGMLTLIAGLGARASQLITTN
ncbi:FAD-dependent oxidoreductase [Tessaracoccus antarcticus]|uniref:Pyridine nucleotide-disulfide oxidoreductase n=1 Tax=Tessaracoccus antarcticus TaxID=2479848 RepID=A0A3M0GXE9_9ACTN|nr:FAD-dependent oxidoreductase [Tessaracoccus antarcticus]RMB62046.1 pyridine nucleotide-disulfide oxidoreductase [Tessaracoccus antarcticus]